MAQIPEKTLEIKGEAQGHESHIGHVSPLSSLVATFGALVVLTVVTVLVAQVDLGATTNMWIAMFVALTKASIVVLFFMHLRYDRPLNAVVFIGSLLFVVLFIGFAMTDSKEYQPSIKPDYSNDLTNGGT